MWKKELTIKYMDELPGPKEELEEGTIYISKKFGCSKHLCMCGCKIVTVLPFNNIINGKDHGWKLIEKDGKVSFTPSVGNFSWDRPTYHAHYYITNNFIRWL